jgi:hypothetical protein
MWVRGSFILPAAPGGDLFLYNWWNPRATDALETRVMAFYRAPERGRRGGRPGTLERGPFRGVPLGSGIFRSVA